MARTKEKKIENELKKAINEMAQEEVLSTAKKPSKKIAKKSSKNSTQKLEKNEIEVVDNIVEVPSKEKRSRKKQNNSAKVLVAKNIENEKNDDNIIELDDKIEDVENNENEISEVIKDEVNDDSDNNENTEDLILNDEKDIKIVNRKKKKENKMETPKKDYTKTIIVGILVIGILVFAIFVANKTMKTVIPNVAAVNSVSDLNNKLNASLVPPQDAKNIQYGIEGDGIARIDYARSSKNGTMNLIFRMSKDPDKDLYGESHKWGERTIYIDVVCDDNTIINVESYEALDDTMTLIALWKDNYEYYSLFTKNVSTKEEFYREVNQIVAANHKKQ